MIGGRDERERECRGELVARERRGELSPAQRIALDAHLDGCVSCRMSRAIAADFAADSAVEVDDADRIARMSAAARRWSQRRARPPARASIRSWSLITRWRWRWASRFRVLALSVGVVLVAGTASATVWWWRSSPARLSAPAEPGVPTGSIRPRVPPRVRARTAGPAVPPPMAVAVSAAEPMTTAPPPSEAAPEAVATPRPRSRMVAARDQRDTAESLLRLAGEARGRGEAELAASLYRRLQHEHPHTREATLSSVPWGGLLLRQGQAERALAQFDRYIAREPRGNLLPEALYGQGRALAAIPGRAADERQTWRRLLADTPGSAYESHARRRLDELK